LQSERSGTGCERGALQRVSLWGDSELVWLCMCVTAGVLVGRGLADVLWI